MAASFSSRTWGLVFSQPIQSYQPRLMATPQGPGAPRQPRPGYYHTPKQVSNQEPPDSGHSALTTTLLGWPLVRMASSNSRWDDRFTEAAVKLPSRQVKLRALQWQRHCQPRSCWHGHGAQSANPQCMICRIFAYWKNDSHKLHI